MLSDLQDARRAFGIGLIFFGYALLRLADYAITHDAWRKRFAAWVAENKAEVTALREQLQLEEGL